MNRMLGPASIRLVGATFVCLLLILEASASAPSNSPDPLSKIEEYHSDFLNHKEYSDTGPLRLPGNTVYFPWTSRQFPGLGPDNPDIAPPSGPIEENVVMNGSQPQEQVQDLLAMNTAKQRDITCKESQRKGPGSQSFVNSMDVRVVGPGNSKKEWTADGPDEDGLENFVDNAVASGMDRAYNKGSSDAANPQKTGNHLNVDVSGISVSAINTVEGGSAVATSNIVIKPVQVIVCPPEVEEKLK
jgi:hypothetical protein